MSDSILGKYVDVLGTKSLEYVDIWATRQLGLAPKNEPVVKTPTTATAPAGKAAPVVHEVKGAETIPGNPEYIDVFGFKVHKTLAMGSVGLLTIALLAKALK